MAPLSDPNFRALERRVVGTLACMKRLLDLSDIEWVRQRLGGRAASRVRAEHRRAFFQYARVLEALAGQARRELSGAGTVPLEELIRFDAESRWLMIQLKAWGWMAFVGVPVAERARNAMGQFEKLVPSVAAPTALPSRS